MGQTHVHAYLDKLLTLIDEGRIDPSFVISHHLALEDGPEAYDMFLHDKDRCTKVVLRPH
jgi:threonine dehydrogenase-like Zn-dependent dehydrogenase